MTWTSQCTSTSTTSSTSIQSSPNQFSRIRSHLCIKGLSQGAKNLMTLLRISAGHKGMIKYRTRKLAEGIGASVSSTREYLEELKQSGLIDALNNPGYSNTWVINDVVGEKANQQGGCYSTDRGPAALPADILKNVHKKNVDNVPDIPAAGYVPEAPPSPEPKTNDNAVKIANLETRITNIESSINIIANQLSAEPPTAEDEAATPTAPDESTTSPPSQHPEKIPPASNSQPRDSEYQPTSTKSARLNIHEADLVTEIEELTGETHGRSRGNWIRLVREAPEETIRAGMSALRIAMNETSVLRPGAYLNSTIRRILEPDEVSQGLPVTIEGPRPPEDYVRMECPSSVAPTPRYEEPEPEPIDPEDMKKGWAFYYKTQGVRGMLSLMERCVPETVNVKELWDHTSQLLKNLDERSLVDRFLDLVVGRLRHLEAQAAA